MPLASTKTSVETISHKKQTRKWENPLTYSQKTHVEHARANTTHILQRQIESK